MAQSDSLVKRLRSASRWGFGKPHSDEVMPSPEILAEAAEQIDKLTLHIEHLLTVIDDRTADDHEACFGCANAQLEVTAYRMAQAVEEQHQGRYPRD